MILKILFFIFLTPPLYHFIIYPALLLILDLIKKQEDWELLKYIPSISVIVITRNGERSIKQRVENLLSCNYPEEKREIIIISDNSSDNTMEILKAFPQVKSYQSKERKGKAALVNLAVKNSKGKVLVFSDDNTEFQEDNLKEIVKPFYYHEITAVCGKLSLRGKNRIEAAYWAAESFFKRVQGKFKAVAGANGANYAVRRDAFIPLPEDKLIMDDFIETMEILAAGGKIVYAKNAIASEEHGTTSEGEMERKVRIGRGNRNALPYIWNLITGKGGGMAVFFTLSTKLLRWFMAPILLLLFLISGLFTTDIIDLYTIVFIVQAIFYITGAVFYFLKHRYSMFFWSNFALFFGMVITPENEVPYWDK